MPYEEISDEEYHKKVATIKELNIKPEELVWKGNDPTAEKFCDGDNCTL